MSAFPKQPREMFSLCLYLCERDKVKISSVGLFRTLTLTSLIYGFISWGLKIKGLAIVILCVFCISWKNNAVGEDYSLKWKNCGILTKISGFLMNLFDAVYIKYYLYWKNFVLKIIYNPIRKEAFINLKHITILRLFPKQFLYYALLKTPFFTITEAKFIAGTLWANKIIPVVSEANKRWGLWLSHWERQNTLSKERINLWIIFAEVNERFRCPWPCIPSHKPCGNRLFWAALLWQKPSDSEYNDFILNFSDYKFHYISGLSWCGFRWLISLY